MTSQLRLTAAFALALASTAVHGAVVEWGQCGGIGYTGATACVSPYVCTYQNDWYSQCLPASSTATTTKATTSTTSTSKSSTTTTISSTSKTSTSTTSSSSSTSTTGLKGLNLLAKAHGRYFGTASDNPQSSTDTTYTALTGNFSEFGVMTPGNNMKWQPTENVQNVFTFTNPDASVAWSHARGQTIRGHNLVWYSQLPSWLTGGTWTNATLTAAMNNHITNLVTHFKGQLYCWDVINEPFNDDGTWRADVFYNTMGSSFIPIALKTAHSIDSTAKLYINDYNVETTGAKSNAHYALAQTLLAQGIPLHGFGIQGHLIVGSSPTASAITANVARFAALGLEWAITELDIRMTLPTTAALLAQQATDYANVVAACVASTACVGITTWDTSDDVSWVPSTFSGQGAALLFDANKQPKPAYYSVANTLAAATVAGKFTSWYSA